MTYPNKNELPAGGVTYALEKAVELLTTMDESDRYISVEMQWGIDHELEAIAAFTGLTGLDVYHTGDEQRSIELGDDISCTPDGLIGLDSGIEVKAPKSLTHLKYLQLRCAAELKAECPNYYWQIMGAMHITGRDTWYFASYDPRYHHKAHQLNAFRIERNEEDMRLLEARLLMAIVYRNHVLKTMRSTGNA